MVGWLSEAVTREDAMPERYEVAITVWLDGNQWAQWSGTISSRGGAGFGYSVNEAMVELTKQMDFYHRNWEEFAEPD